MLWEVEGAQQWVFWSSAVGSGRSPTAGLLGARAWVLVGILWLLIAAGLCPHLCINSPTSGSTPIGRVLEWPGPAPSHLHSYFSPPLACNFPASLITTHLNLPLHLSRRLVQLLMPHALPTPLFHPRGLFLFKLYYCHLIWRKSR